MKQSVNFLERMLNDIQNFTTGFKHKKQTFSGELDVSCLNCGGTFSFDVNASFKYGRKVKCPCGKIYEIKVNIEIEKV